MGQAAEFVLSAPGPRLLPADGAPEVAFAGRSNVGKSSLVGAVMGAPSLVRTSRTPGRTQLLNYFRARVDGETLGICDLPGYGWARLSHAQRREMQRMVEDYLAERDPLLVVVLLVDGRHEAVSPLDVEMARSLSRFGRPLHVVATKCDALPSTTRQRTLARIGRALGLPPPAATSARTGLGVEAIRRHLVELARAWV